MKTLLIIGLILIVLGVIGVIVRTVDVPVDQDTADLGVAKVTVTDTEESSLPLYLGIAAVAAGLVLVAIGAAGRK